MTMFENAQNENVVSLLTHICMHFRNILFLYGDDYSPRLHGQALAFRQLGGVEQRVAAGVGIADGLRGG